MKPEVLMVCSLTRPVREALAEAYQLHRLYEAEDKAGFLNEIGEGVRGIATDGHSGASAELMDALPNLEVISSCGVGVDSVDLSHAAKRNIIVANTPDVLNDDVANMAVALLLATSRKLVSNDRYVRSGTWRAEGYPPLARGIRGKTVGILGLGRIGKNIAKKLEIFGCDLAYHGRNVQPDQPYRYYGDLIECARASDYIIIICPGGEATNNIVGRDVLDALGPNGTLINVARGSIVNEPELVAALKDGRLGGAGLDVFADEPNVPEELLEMDNVVLQPHQGSATIETRKAMGDLTVDNLAAHFAGKPVLTPIS
ncbi:2-ketogluconate reductase [bacterium MnTg02]|nr:2-ketogluconate reductase [bacterium MnTg02]